MKRIIQVIAIFLFLFLRASLVNSQENYYFHFSGTTNEENGITVMGPAFGGMPMGEVSYGMIPTDNAFEGATDGRGMIVVADPGEGATIITSPLSTDNCALLRCSVRSTAPHVSIYLASIDQGEKVYVSTITANNATSFVGKYDRIADFFLPPSTGFQGLLQLVNTSETEPVSFYIDNFEILDAGRDILQIPVNEIVAGSIQSNPIETPTLTTTNTPLPTQTPSPQPTQVEPTPTGTSTPTSVNTPIPTPTPPVGESVRTIPLSNLEAGAKALEFIRIPAGSFMMGSQETEKDRSDGEALHKVTFTKDIYMAKFEVTQGQWKAVMGSIPKEQYGSDSDIPIQFITWTQIQTFIEEINKLNLGVFRLPTDAEWEYACRAGTSTRFYWGDDLSDSEIEQYAWYFNNAKAPKPVGSKVPNHWGLYDMSGNVWEFCGDWYEPSTVEEQIDPQGPFEGTFRIIRGGSWANDPMDCRSALRQSLNINNNPDFSAGHMGFRLVLETNGTSEPTPDPTPLPTLTPKPTINWIGDALFYKDFSNIADLQDWNILNGEAIQSGGYLIIKGLDNVGEINHTSPYSETGYSIEWNMTFPNGSSAETWGGFSLYTDQALDSPRYGLTGINEIFITFTQSGYVNVLLYGTDTQSNTTNYWSIAQAQASVWNSGFDSNRFRFEVHQGQWILSVNDQIILIMGSEELFTLESISLIAGKNSVAHFSSVRIAKLLQNRGKVTASDGAIVDYPLTSESVGMQVLWDIRFEPLGQEDAENKPVSPQYHLEIKSGTIEENISLAIPVNKDLLPENYDPALLSLQEFNPDTNLWEAVEYFNYFDPEAKVFYISLPLQKEPPSISLAKTVLNKSTIHPNQEKSSTEDFRISYSILYMTNAITFEGSHFRIHYNPLTVKKDAAWTAMGSGDYGSLAVPDYIEDMDKAFNLALKNLRAIQDSNGQAIFLDPTDGGKKRVDVYVKNLGQVDGNTSFGGPIRISEDIFLNWNHLKSTVAHEMVHFFQGNYYGLNGYFQWFATRGNQWFVEATAQYYGAKAAELTENQKGAFYADNPEEYLRVPITSNSETSYYTAGHFLEWVETKLYPGVPIVANTLKNRNFGVDIENLYTAMLMASPSEEGKAFGSFDSYCDFLLTSPDDMDGFGSKIKTNLDNKAGMFFSDRPSLSNTQTFLTYNKEIPHLSAGYAYVGINNTDQALLVIQAEQTEINGVNILQSYFYAPRGKSNADYTQGIPQLNFSTIIRENVGKNETINSFEFLVVNPQIRLDSNWDVIFYLLRPPSISSIQSGQITWSTLEKGNIPDEYIKGYKIYRNGSLLNSELAPYASAQQSYTNNLIQPNDSITVTVVDQFDNEWPKPPKPVEPSPTPTATFTAVATHTPVESPTPTATLIDAQQNTPTPTAVAQPTPTLKPNEIIVSGRVMDYGGINGLEGIQVRFHPYTNVLNPIVAITDANGYYSVILPTNTKYNVVVVKDGYRSSEYFGMTFDSSNSNFDARYSMIPKS